MVYPATSIGSQWTDDEELDASDMHARIDVPFDAIRSAISLDDTGWVTPTLGASWVAYTGGTAPIGPRHRLYHGWTVLKGSMKSGVQTTTVFTLPVGMRPVSDLFFDCYATSGAVEVAVFATGAIAVGTYVGSGSNTQVALDNIRFIAEQ